MDELVLGDLYALAALRTRGVEPVRTAADGRRTAWIFVESPEVRTALEEFYGRRLTVDAMGFSERVRAAKAEAMAFRSTSTM